MTPIPPTGWDLPAYHHGQVMLGRLPGRSICGRIST